MTREEMTRTIISSTIQKYIRDISSPSDSGHKPDRIIRKLIDLGMNFSTGRFQKKFFNTAQTMLENKKSEYYTLVKNIVAHVNHDTIRTFGLNLGYNSCTYGAKIIRENEAQFGFNIPWAVIFSFPSQGHCEYIAKTDEYINQGREVGIYTYLIFTEKKNIKDCEKIIKKYSDCVFFVFILSDGCTSSDEADDLYSGILKKYHNVMTMISTQSDNFISSAEKMKNEKMLYGAYLIYSNEDTDKIVSQEWVNSFSQTECPFVFLIPDMKVSYESKKRIAEYVKSVRTGHNAPFIMINTAADLLTIDTIVSDDSCSIWFDSDGNGNTFERKLPYNMNDFTLIEILKANMPRGDTGNTRDTQTF